jgi:hypothetical protein
MGEVKEGDKGIKSIREGKKYIVFPIIFDRYCTSTVYRMDYLHSASCKCVIKVYGYGYVWALYSCVCHHLTSMCTPH